MQRSRFLTLLRGTATLLAATTLPGCAQIYRAPDLESMAATHATMAIVPPMVTMEAAKGMDAETLRQSQEEFAKVAQNSTYTWLLQRRGKGKIPFEPMEPTATNTQLQRAGWKADGSGKVSTPKEICAALKTNALLRGQFHASKPMSAGTAIALALLTGGGGVTASVKGGVSIHDCKSDKLMWKYDTTFSGGLGSTSESLMDGMLRSIAKRLPYNDS